MDKLQFGWAEVDITPKCKISLAGEFYERVSDEVETPLTVTALAIKCGNEQTIFCSCDVVKIGEALMDNVRAGIKNPEIDPSKVIISAIHTHTAFKYTQNIVKEEGQAKFSPMDYINDLMPKDCVYIPDVSADEAMDPDDALAFFSEKLIEAIELAWANLEDGGYKPAFGRVAVGMNRRVCYSDNTARMWGDVDKATFTKLEAGNDNGMELLFIYDKNGKMTGVVSNIACPAQVVEQRSIISSDYWGKVKILMREKYGEDFRVLGLCSAAGDQCPRDLIRWVEPETPIKDPNVIRDNPKYRRADPSMFDVAGTWRIGKRIVNEIELILDETKDEEIITETVMKHKSQVLNLPLRKVTESETVEAHKAITEFFKGKKQINFMDTADLYIYTGTLNRYEYQKNHNVVPTEVHTVRLGDIAFATNPFELFLDYGNEMRARSDAAQTFIIQLANGGLAYLPTEEAEMHSHYSAYVTSGFVGHVGGDILVRETLESIKELFKK